MDENQLHAIATKSVKGVFALVSRSFFIQLLGIGTSFILTLYLEPESFGVFFVVSSIIVFFNYFQDIGLAASLIQKKTEPTLVDLRTVFTVQQIIVLAIILPALFFSGALSSFYGLNNDGHLLLIVLLLSFFFTSLRTVPTVLLERNLDFNRLVIPQILENLAYNLSLIICAISGLGVKSFIVAVALRSIVGLVTTYIIKPWPVGFAFDKSSFKTLISFGIPFQTNSILALFKDDFLTIVLGKILPIAQLGYVGFAQRLSYLPLRLVMDNIIKITFPSFSRLQEDKEALKVAIEKALFLIALAIFPVAVGIITFSPFLIEFIPRYQKWEPALLSIVFFSLGSVISSISTPLTNFLNAIGRVKITLYFMVFWTALIWITTLLLINLIGFDGVAMASFAVSITSIGVFIVAKRYVSFSVFGVIYKQLIAALVMYVFVISVGGFVSSLIHMIIFAIISLTVYMICMMIMAKKEILGTTRFIIRSIKSKQ